MTLSPRFTLSLVLLAAAAVPAATAHADDATKQAKVQQLFTVMKVDGISNQVANSVMQQTQSLAQRQFGPSPTPEQQKQIDDFRNKILAVVNESVGWKAIQPEFSKLYGDTYTEPEIDGILAFYKSPIGQSMLSKAPELAQKSAGIAQQHMVAIQPQLKQIVQDFVNQGKPASGPGAASPGASTTAPPPASPRPAPSLSPQPKP